MHNIDSNPEEMESAYYHNSLNDSMINNEKHEDMDKFSNKCKLLVT